MKIKHSRNNFTSKEEDMKYLLSLWRPKHRILKFFKGVLRILDIILFFAMVVLPFCNVDGIYLACLKYVWVFCAVANLYDTVVYWINSYKNKLTVPMVSLFFVLILQYLCNYWDVFSQTTTFFLGIVILIMESIVWLKIHKTVKFTTHHDISKRSSTITQRLVSGLVYLAAMVLFAWGHYLSKTMIFVFGTVAAILLLVAAFSVVESGFELKRKTFNIIGFAVDIVSLIGLAIYLIYLTPNDKGLREIVLTIIAAIISGAITLAGVAWTIKDNSKKLREERKLSIKPYLETKSDQYTDVLTLPLEDVTYIEIKNKSILTYQGSIPESLDNLRLTKNRIEKGEEIDALDKALFEINYEDFFQKNYLLYYEIANRGAGNAINVHFKVNAWPLQPFCITTSNPKKFVFILRDRLIPKDKNKYTLEMLLTYSDIASLGRYSQKEEFDFWRNDDKLNTLQLSGSLLTSPMEM